LYSAIGANPLDGYRHHAYQKRVLPKLPNKKRPAAIGYMHPIVTAVFL
jgi:hypothetical protein